MVKYKIKVLVFGGSGFIGINLIDCAFPTWRSFISVVLEVSILEIGKCHNKSNIVLIFFLENSWKVLFPIPFILSNEDNKYS